MEASSIKSCSNCCAQQKEISNLISSLATTGGNVGEDENLSISAAVSSLFSFWVGEEVTCQTEDVNPLSLCAKCVQILQIVYNFSTQFIELSRKEGQVCKKLEELRDAVFNGGGRGAKTTPTEGRLRKRRRSKDVTKKEEDDGSIIPPDTLRRSRRKDPGEKYHPKEDNKTEFRPDFAPGIEVKEEPLSLEDDEMQVDENYPLIMSNPDLFDDTGDYLSGGDAGEEFGIDPLKFLEDEEDDHHSERSCPTPLSSDFIPSDDSESEYATKPADSSHIKELLPCPVEHCGRTFNRNDRLRYHLAHAHPEVPLPEKRKKGRPPLSSEIRKYSCPEESCERTFSRTDRLKTHVKLEHKFDLGMIPATTGSCPTPRNSDYIPSESDSEAMKHADFNVKDLPCPVEHCTRTFTRNDRLREHLAHAHPEVPLPEKKKQGRPPLSSGTRKYSCPEESCGRKFSRKDRLQQHAKSEHQLKLEGATVATGGGDAGIKREISGRTDKKPRRRIDKPCPVCGKLVRSTGLQAHIRTHTKEKLPGYKKRIRIPTKSLCPTCGKLITTSCLHSHIASHNAQKNIPCLQCDKLFRTVRNLGIHVDEVHNKVRSICPHCGITCARKWALDQHVKTKHLDPAEKRYECETCGKSYRQERHFRQHVRIHDNEGRKDFQCPICSKVFCRKENVKLHLKSGLPCGNLYNAEGGNSMME